jgi:hypothetical protein
MASRVAAGNGKEWLRELRMLFGRGRQGEVRSGEVRHVEFGFGMAGKASCVQAGSGKSCFGRRGDVRLVLVCIGVARMAGEFTKADEWLT